MTKLDCSVDTCVHNERNMCCKSEILVQGREAVTKEETCCGSYDKRGCGCKNEIKDPNGEAKITCEARNCYYNAEGKCEAGHIGVAGSRAEDKSQTECSTFIES